jgi:hypothetical protein
VVAGTLDALWLIAVAVGLGALLTARQRLQIRTYIDMSSATVRLMERRQNELADWLHDDVCTSLSLVRARLATDAAPRAIPAVQAELADLDHKLRLRQLDVRMAAGHVRLGELIQPYVRMAVDHGVDVADAPSWDDASHEVDPDQARLVRRALAVAVPNAVRAGARRIAVRACVQPAGPTVARAVTVEVDDDAGGLGSVPVPAGRALDGLRRQVSELSIERIPGGTRVRVVVSAGGRAAV